MKIITTILAGLFFLSGLVWFLQGLCILPGSFMSCQTQWTLYGGLLMLASAGVIGWLYWPKTKKIS